MVNLAQDDRQLGQRDDLSKANISHQSEKAALGQLTTRKANTKSSSCTRRLRCRVNSRADTENRISTR